MKTNAMFYVLFFALLFTVNVNAQVGSKVSPTVTNIKGELGISGSTTADFNPGAMLHVKATGNEIARFESSLSNKWISFNEGTERKGILWSLGNTMTLRSDEGNVRFQTLGNNTRMDIGSDGDIGVGLTASTSTGKFHIRDNSTVSDPQLNIEETGTDYARLQFGNTTGNGYWHIAGRGNGTDPKMNFWFDEDGAAGPIAGTNIMSINGLDKYVGIGTASPTNPLNLQTPAPTGNLRVVNVEVTSGNLASQTDVLQLKTNSGASHSNYQFIECEEGTVKKFVIEKTGATAIGSGTIATGFMLSVDGKIISEELKVQTSGSWPDYVFKKEYDLKSLEEVETSIMENGHLPGIPSAVEVKEEGGIMVGDMQRRTIEKVEELTLYAIDANKRIKELNKEKEELKSTVEALIKRIEQLEQN